MQHSSVPACPDGSGSVSEQRQPSLFDPVTGEIETQPETTAAASPGSDDLPRLSIIRPSDDQLLPEPDGDESPACEESRRSQEEAGVPHGNDDSTTPSTAGWSRGDESSDALDPDPGDDWSDNFDDDGASSPSCAEDDTAVAKKDIPADMEDAARPEKDIPSANVIGTPMPELPPRGSIARLGVRGPGIAPKRIGSGRLVPARLTWKPGDPFAASRKTSRSQFRWEVMLTAACVTAACGLGCIWLLRTILT